MIVVAFEGIDGSGKSSLCQEVLSTLTRKGIQCDTPTSNKERPIRKAYSELLRDNRTFPNTQTSLYLGSADFLSAYSSTLMSGMEVSLFERFSYSVLADSIALGCPEEVWKFHLKQFPVPDLIVFLDVKPSTALARRQLKCSEAEAGGPFFLKQGESFSDGFLRYQSVVRGAFLDLLPPQKTLRIEEGVSIAAAKEQVVRRVIQLIKEDGNDKTN